MEYNELMGYVTTIIFPIKIREYFFQDDWENTRIPEEEGNAFIEYSKALTKVTSEKNPKKFRNFLKLNSHWYEEETQALLSLDNKTLDTLANLIEIKKTKHLPRRKMLI